MINTLAEFIAIFAECFIVTRMLIIYFKLKSDEYKLLKSAALFTALFITDVLGSFCIINELFLISTCVLCEFGFAVVFLKGSMNEKILISLMNYALLYFINLPVIILISTISDMSASHLVASQNAEKIICLFIGKLLQFFITELLLWNRRKDEYRFKFNECMVILSAFFITLMIGFVMYIITIDRHITNYVYLAVTLLLSILDIIIFFFIRKMNVVNCKEKERFI